jgi:hypothetical protein
MNLADQFNRLDKLIIDRSPNVSTMRGILHSIREQVEAYQKKAEEHDTLKVAYEKLQTEHAKLKTAQAQPSFDVIDKTPQPPSETFM